MGASLRISIKDKKGKEAEVVFGDRKGAKKFEKEAEKLHREVDEMFDQIAPKKRKK